MFRLTAIKYATKEACASYVGHFIANVTQSHKANKIPSSDTVPYFYS